MEISSLLIPYLSKESSEPSPCQNWYTMDLMESPNAQGMHREVILTVRAFQNHPEDVLLLWKLPDALYIEPATLLTVIRKVAFAGEIFIHSRLSEADVERMATMEDFYLGLELRGAVAPWELRIAVPMHLRYQLPSTDGTFVVAPPQIRCSPSHTAATSSRNTVALIYDVDHLGRPGNVDAYRRHSPFASVSSAAAESSVTMHMPTGALPLAATVATVTAGTFAASALTICIAIFIAMRRTIRAVN